MDEQDPIDALLHASRPAPVDDDGFTEHLLTQLPARPARARPWLVPAGALIGAVLAILFSGASADLVSAAQALLTDHRTSVVAFLPALLVLAGCAWALSDSK